MKSIGILGGGVAGLSLSYFLNRQYKVTLFEKEEICGGLARSFCSHGIYYDIGPHIIFSKNSKVLDFMNSICEMKRHRRSNVIYYDGDLIGYPFENFFGQLSNKNTISYILETFINNPYKNEPIDNMLSFFLKTFGEGITNMYLKPYNEKIWKMDISLMNTKMVNRIPTPPKEDIIQAAEGKYSDGYTHQLYFTYPKKGGVQTFIDGLENKIKDKKTVNFKKNHMVTQIDKKNKKWNVTCESQNFEFDHIISCIPIHELIKIASKDLGLDKDNTIDKMLYNSLYIVILNTKINKLQEHFVYTIPQDDIIFHRLCHLNFFGENYRLKDGSSTFMCEITFRKGDSIFYLSSEQIIDKCIEGLIKVGCINSKSEINFHDIRYEKYAYVIYDKEHEYNTHLLKKKIEKAGIYLCGRFAEFEYYNMDGVIESAISISDQLNLY